jgi:hypothetical protein
MERRLSHTSAGTRPSQTSVAEVSPIGYQGITSGVGDTEDCRFSRSVKYDLALKHFQEKWRSVFRFENAIAQKLERFQFPQKLKRFNNNGKSDGPNLVGSGLPMRPGGHRSWRMWSHTQRD